jgi:hypothetical protein
MTEAEWLGHAVPGLMLQHLGDRASERKLRLFACNCVELVWRSMLQRDVPALLALAWAAADGSVPVSELAATELNRAQHAPRRGHSVEEHADDTLDAAFSPQGWRAAAGARRAAEAAAVKLAADNGRNTADASREARTALATFLRCMFGNPYRPVAFSPLWRTDTAVSLAAQMYESRDFSAMPILADAVQDAGCDTAELLDHCRSPGPHVRGCQVVDLVLGK